MVNISMKVYTTRRRWLLLWRSWESGDIHFEWFPPDGNGRPQKNDPDETEPRRLFGPDVAGIKTGIAREDLEAHGTIISPIRHVTTPEILNTRSRYADCVEKSYHLSLPEQKSSGAPEPEA